MATPQANPQFSGSCTVLEPYTLLNRFPGLRLAGTSRDID
jgi:hypothetical protein